MQKCYPRLQVSELFSQEMSRKPEDKSVQTCANLGAGFGADLPLQIQIALGK